MNEKDNRYETSLFAVPSSGGGSAEAADLRGRDTAPRWAPDGKRLAFVRASERTASAAGQIYLLPMDGGEARAITELTAGADNPEWSSNT